VRVDFTLAAANALVTGVTAALETSSQGIFKFVYCSGWAAERNQDATLYLEPETRKIKVCLTFGHLGSLYDGRFMLTL
jgi:hypothetical protein